MPRLSDLSLAALLDAFSRPDPTPGGGSASAIAGAMGASLLMMVAGLSKTRHNTADERVALDEARASLAALRDRLASLADEDTDAFNQVMAGYRLPKSTDAEKAVRTAAIQRALKSATSVPLEILRIATNAMSHARPVAQHGNPTAASDVGVGVALLEAAASGAAANVRINLEGIRDAEFKASAQADLELLTRQIEGDARSARTMLQGADAV